MSSFNVLGGSHRKVGANTPIWLGTVKPAPVGGVLASEFAKKGVIIPAGSPVKYEAKTITPLCAYEVKAVDSSTHTLTVKDCGYGIIPAVGAVLNEVKATFSATGACAVVSAVEMSGEDILLTFATSNLDSVAVGSCIAPSASTSAAASGKALKVQPNAYLYNDICINAEYDEVVATGAVVFMHGEGILIDRTPCAAVKAQMAAAVPGVYQVNE